MGVHIVVDDDFEYVIDALFRALGFSKPIECHDKIRAANAFPAVQLFPQVMRIVIPLHRNFGNINAT
jgi:hypothetical protein